MGSPGWNGRFSTIFWRSLCDPPQTHIPVQSKNLPLIIELAGPEGASAVVGKSPSCGWVEPSVRGMYLFFSLILSPVLFPMQVVRTLALVFAVLLAVRLLHSKCKDRRMLPVCLQDSVKAGRSALCDWFAWAVGWGWCLVHPMALRMRDGHRCWEVSACLLREMRWEESNLLHAVSGSLMQSPGALKALAWTSSFVVLQTDWPPCLCPARSTPPPLRYVGWCSQRLPSSFRREKSTDNVRKYLSVVKSIAYAFCAFFWQCILELMEDKILFLPRDGIPECLK